MNGLMPGLDVAPNIHPMLVHFPIVLWVSALALWTLGVARSRSDLFRSGTWFLSIGTLTAVITLISGYLAADGLGHDSPGHDLVHGHRDLMLVATIVGAALTALAWLLRRRQGRLVRWSLVATLLALNAVTTLGADRGALLVYGHGMGTVQNAPSSEPPSHDNDDGHHGEAAPHGH
ncbi:MAG: putative membrane protein [Myxococcota bacterium]|jgi:uncharacterized membrane protein